MFDVCATRVSEAKPRDWPLGMVLWQEASGQRYVTILSRACQMISYTVRFGGGFIYG